MGLLDIVPFPLDHAEVALFLRTMAHLFPSRSAAMAFTAPFGVDPITVSENVSPLALWTEITGQLAGKPELRAMVRAATTGVAPSVSRELKSLLAQPRLAPDDRIDAVVIVLGEEHRRAMLRSLHDAIRELEHRVVVVTVSELLSPEHVSSHAVWATSKVVAVGLARGIGGEVDLGDVVVASQIAEPPEDATLDEMLASLSWVTRAADAELLDRARVEPPGWDTAARRARPQPGTALRRIGALAACRRTIAFPSFDLGEQLVAVEVDGIVSALRAFPQPAGLLVVCGISGLVDAGPVESGWSACAFEAAAGCTAGLLQKSRQLGTKRLGFDSLLQACRGELPGRLRVLETKYVEELYVPRAATHSLFETGSAEVRFRADVRHILRKLASAARAYPLPRAIQAIAATARTFERALLFDDLESAVRQLHDAFQANVLTRASGEMARAVAAGASPREYAAAKASVLATLRSFPLKVSRAEFSSALDEARARSVAKGGPDLEVVAKLLPHEPILRDPAVELLGALRSECERFRARVTAVVGRAGMGKSNAVCAYANEVGQRLPIVFMEGHGDLGEDMLEGALRKAVELSMGSPSPNWRELLEDALDEAGRWLVLCIDGVEENANLARAARAIEAVVARCAELRIYVVLTCRDIAWEAFHERLERFLVGGQPLHLDVFNDVEQTTAMRRYLDHFQIECSFGPEARAVLRNPLLLRLFCIAHRHSNRDRVMDLRPLDVFESYFAAALRRLAESNQALRATEATELLERTADAIWSARGAVPRDALRLSAFELDHPNSVYNQLRLEGVLFEAAGQTQVVVHFVYSQVAEYLIARRWSRRLEAHHATLKRSWNRRWMR